MFEAYTFPNGFAREGLEMYDWLRHYCFSPTIRFKKGKTIILLKRNEKEALEKMKKSMPDIF